jgi:hypothetical protein
MSCPGSVHLEPDIKNEGSSVYAERGTAMHEVSEQCLINNVEPNSYIGKTVNKHKVTLDMVECVQVYVNYIRSLEGKKFYEEKVTLAEVINDCWGTADAVVITGKSIRVIDLKTGGGVKVDAENNTQLLCYALGAYLKYSVAYDIEEVTMTIVQPPLHNIDSWTISLDDLLVFAESLRNAYAAIQNTPNVFSASDKACKWCHAKAQCPELKRIANGAAGLDFNSLQQDSIEFWLTKLPMLSAFINAVELKAKAIMFDGGEIKGWKVVEGRRSRAWTDTDQTELWLKQQGYDQIYTKVALLSPAQMELALKNEHIDLSSQITISVGSPTIAQEKDSRSKVDRTHSAKKDFA